MMETYLSNRFNEIVYNEQTSTLYHILRAETREMIEEDFKDMLLKWRAVAFKFQPRFLLIDTVEMEFAISPDLQLWITEHITTPVVSETGVSKICFVMPQEFVSKISMNQYIEEADKVSQDTLIKYVSDRTKAEEWLK